MTTGQLASISITRLICKSPLYFNWLASTRTKIAHALGSQVDHCKNPNNCDNDPFQFHLTQKPNDNGKLSFPYNPQGNDNHYAIAKSEPDLLQCRVVVNYHGPEFDATVYDVNGDQKGTGSGRLENKEDSFTVSGLPLDLAIIYQADDNNPVAFNYGAASFWNTNLLKFFFWESDHTGVSNQYDDQGRYCKIDAKSSNEKNIECYFPCAQK